VNALGAHVLLVATHFLSRGLRPLDRTADTITPRHPPALSLRARLAAARIIDGAAVLVKEAGAPRLALDAAAKLHAGGRLRQAEEAYRSLAQKHGDAESYRGLALTQVALEDLGAALIALRDGASSLAKRRDRAGAIGLLAEAVGIAPGDLGAHRRLAAAHANAGDAVAACAEYERFVDYARAAGDSRRAWLELTYARETLGDLPGLIRIVDRLMPAGATATPTRANAPAARAVSRPVGPPAPLPAEVRRLVPPVPPGPPRILIDDLPRTRPVGAPSAVVIANAHTMTSADAFDEAPVDLAERIAPRSKDALRRASQAAWTARPAIDIESTLASLMPGTTSDQQAAVGAMRATVLIGARDPRATEAVLDAARRLLSLHKVQAASDLLLDFIAAGYTDREAQRLLIEVDCGLGRRDVARDKCRLLGEAYRLDGRTDTANDVERLASII